MLRERIRLAKVAKSPRGRVLEREDHVRQKRALLAFLRRHRRAAQRYYEQFSRKKELHTKYAYVRGVHRGREGAFHEAAVWISKYWRTRR